MIRRFLIAALTALAVVFGLEFASKSEAQAKPRHTNEHAPVVVRCKQGSATQTVHITALEVRGFGGRLVRPRHGTSFEGDIPGGGKWSWPGARKGHYYLVTVTRASDGVTILYNQIVVPGQSGQDLELAAIDPAPDSRDTQIADLTAKLAAANDKITKLEAEIAAWPTPITSQGLVVGIGYGDPYSSHTVRRVSDTSVSASFYNDSIYQTWIQYLEVHFSGSAVPGWISPFTVNMLDEETGQNWGVANTATAQWDPYREVWIARFYLNHPLGATAQVRPRFRYDSSGFANVAGSTDELSVTIPWTESFDGLTVFRGPFHGSGTVVVSYE